MAVGNIISRLQGLKNVSGRRAMPGQGILEEMEAENPPIQGIANPPPKPQNLPENDLGGELTPQSYDVRANTTQPTTPESPFNYRHAQMPKQGIDWGQMGRNLWNHLNKPAQLSQAYTKASEYVNNPENLRSLSNVIREPPEEPAMIQEAGKFIPGLLPQQSNLPISNKIPEQPKRTVKETYESANTPYGPPTPPPYGPSAQPADDKINKAMEQPYKYAAYGAAETVANHPILSAKFQKITGENYDEQVAAQVKTYEEAMQGIQDRYEGINTQLSDNAEKIEQRILNNQSTDADKYYIGMALLMPLIIGGLFGKEAGVGALGGTAQGFADILGRKQEGIREDEAALLGISKEQAGVQEKLGNLALDRAKLEPEIRKNLPKEPNPSYIGMRKKPFINPDTQESEEAVEMAPELLIRPEYATEARFADNLKTSKTLAAEKTYADEVDYLTGDILEILSQVDDKDRGLFTDGMNSYIAGKDKSLLSKLSPIVNFQGRQVNAGVELTNKLALLLNSYGHAKDLGQADRAMQAHGRNVFDNPFSTFLSYENAIEQMLSVRDLTERGVIESAFNNGFYTEPIIQHFEERSKPMFQKLNQNKYNDPKVNDVYEEVRSLG